ncbi:cysteine-rich receptor-like protein kinase 2 isoform X1 [Macadamia integrifolia]|uniref:cysteine-rich receptor-like protein kinase 2 isoform X1 n=1 Tax=Macadamia integrifolia TaxID=60698 RepID=UPI001C4F1A9B|nr:cysteine-rich receptor-like protein kinase 2 isoform X1 [Macadamia integrifolia]
MVLLILYFTFFLAIFSSSSSDDSSTVIIRRVCSKTQASDPQSFDVNFVDSMEIIYQKISETGFGVSASGDNASDLVYGLGQCYNYLSNVDCRLCYAESRVKLPLCLPATVGRVYLDGCFLSYSNYNFSQDVIDNSDSYVCGSSKNVSDEIRFSNLTTQLIQNLTSEAYEQVDYYKQGSVFVSSGVSAYGIAQCWRSVNKSGCKDCLESARKNIVGCLPGSDGKALNVGCFVRYSTEPFYLNVSSQSGSSSVGNRLKVALGTVFAVVVVIGGAIIFWVKRRSFSRFNDADGSSEIIRSISESHLSFKYDDLRKATNEFDLGNKIGQGGYGTVFKGILPDGREIAVKRLFFNTRQWVDQFFNEVNLISGVQHKNLVKLLGCSIEGPESLLVYEYLSNTSLDRFLYDAFKNKVLDWDKRFDIILGTAEGLAYLHEASEIRIIHRDIKASNILLDERLRPKIADFGLARYFAEGQSHLSTGIAGTLGYMAPEYVVHGQLTEKADVYSYGVLILEVLTGRKNTTSMSSTVGHYLMSQVWDHYTSETLMETIDPALQGQCSEEQVVKVFTIGLLCAQASPSLRPTMRKVVEMLTNMTRDLPVPTQPPYINVKGVDAINEGSETSFLISSASRNPISTNQMSLSILQGR